MSTSYVNGNVAVQLNEEQNLELQGQRELTLLTGLLTWLGEHPLPALGRTALRCLGAFAATVALSAAVVVGIDVATFSYTAQNSAMQSELDELRSKSNDYETTIATRGNLQRIQALATGTYGMVAVSDETVLDLDTMTFTTSSSSSDLGGASSTLE